MAGCWLIVVVGVWLFSRVCCSLVVVCWLLFVVGWLLVVCCLLAVDFDGRLLFVFLLFVV